MRPDLAVWTPERVETLITLWGDLSLSAQEIGRRIGLGKNAVVGKAHRLKLPGRASPIRPGKPKPTVTKEARLRLAPVPVREEPEPVPLQPLPPKRRPQQARVVPPQRLAGGGPRATRCQWIAGEPSWDDACKCGQPVAPGRPYCAEHWHRAWKKSA